MYLPEFEVPNYNNVWYSSVAIYNTTSDLINLSQTQGVSVSRVLVIKPS